MHQTTADAFLVVLGEKAPDWGCADSRLLINSQDLPLDSSINPVALLACALALKIAGIMVLNRPMPLAAFDAAYVR